jgi:hypothetical protein
MRLAELEPRWWADAGRHGQGMHFLCPVCKKERIAVAFANPIDGGAIAPNCRAYWSRSGETFDAITLEPSVDASEAGHWHGFIKDGTIIGEHANCEVLLGIQDGEVTVGGTNAR